MTTELTKPHRWSGAPGMYCLDCGNESPLEDALLCRDCQWSGGPHHIDHCEPCQLHAVWQLALATCPPDPELVQHVNRLLQERTRG